MESMLKTTSGVKNLFFSIGTFCLFLINYTTIRKEVRSSMFRTLRGSEEVNRSLGHEEMPVDSIVKKPLMHTFFEPVKGGCCGMTEEGHINLVHAWETAWQSYGWETRVLNEADARSHPYFDLFQHLLIEADVNEYDRRCFWRWLAISNQPNGGWMADYDNFPLQLTAQLGLEMEKEPGFKSWQTHVPALLQADKESWDRIIGHMMNFIRPDLEVKIISDMQLLLYLHDHLSEQDMGVSVWEDKVHNGFPYQRGGDGAGPKIDCDVATSYLTAHLSHRSSHMAMEEWHTYPKIPGMSYHEHAEKRGKAAYIMMQDYRDHCVNQADKA